jgi:hypothetical protein
MIDTNALTFPIEAIERLLIRYVNSPDDKGHKSDLMEYLDLAYVQDCDPDHYNCILVLGRKLYCHLNSINDDLSEDRAKLVGLAMDLLNMSVKSEIRYGSDVLRVRNMSRVPV